MLIIGIGAFSNLSIFSMALNKLTNISITNTSNSVRLVLGFQLFWAAPLIYKVLGIPYMNVENYMRSGEVALSKYKLSLNLSYLGFVNAIGKILKFENAPIPIIKTPTIINELKYFPSLLELTNA